MDQVHFRNFLGVSGSSLCGVLSIAPDRVLTLDPAEVTCERCLGLLGRLRDANIAAPSGKKQKPES